MQMTSIPTIDLSGVRHDAAARRRAAAAIDQACREIGFFLIKGHGVDQALIDDSFQAADRFFRRPEAEKRAILQPAKHIGRGYTPVAGESLALTLPGEKTAGDLKEMIDMGPVDVGTDAYYTGPGAGDFFAENLWPAQPPGFRPTMERYYREVNGLADELMRLFALALALPEPYFEHTLDKSISALRVICYPEQREAPVPGQLRSGAHTDYGTLTILTSSQAVGGLQARHRDGYWVDVVPEPGAFVINIGDAMQMWTNDRWVSTLHRVVNPPAALAGDAARARRHSVVFFHQPNYDALIDTLPTCIDAEHPRRHAAISYGEHWTHKWMSSRPGM